MILAPSNVAMATGSVAKNCGSIDAAAKLQRFVLVEAAAPHPAIIRTYDLSAASYVSKPVTIEALVEVIRTLGKYWLEIVELPDNGGAGI